jgi:hypothetical protein
MIDYMESSPWGSLNLSARVRYLFRPRKLDQFPITQERKF